MRRADALAGCTEGAELKAIVDALEGPTRSNAGWSERSRAAKAPPPLSVAPQLRTFSPWQPCANFCREHMQQVV
jgi:hypothetical protein